ncbi:RILP-like protein 1 isoform X2 [Watersipora subatra]|uniref:RILP-like protein 1 isoform X2 n=1 Tax=Watersipora subatra TaxID=2589382 RepID=UPI00355AF03B
MESSLYRKEMEDYVSVVDVYDSAALIGKDFEYLIEQYGVETVTDLMPKVIRVLEQLEYLAGKYEKENEELLHLESTIKRLHSEKDERTKERQQYEQEIEQIEESYRKETKDLCQMVAHLQDQNRRLQARLKDNVSGQEEALEKTEEDSTMIENLREKVNEQRGQIKGLQKEVKSKDLELDSIQKQLDKLVLDNLTLRKSTSSCRAETEHLVSQQVELENALHEKDQHILSIKDKITLCEKSHHCSNFMQTQVAQLSSTVRDTRMKTNIKTMQAKHLIDEKSELQSLLQDRDQQLRIIEERCQGDRASGEVPNIIGQVVGNVSDPDNPRFTLNELKDVLTERNTLKSKLIEIEEELQYYKTRANESEGDTSWQEEELATEPPSVDDCYAGDVQGPINKEPWEKLYGDGKPESGIRKFFDELCRRVNGMITE